MAEMTIEEAAAQLDAAVRAVRRLRESGAEPAYVLAVYRAKKRALAMSVLEEAETGYAQNYAGANEGDAVAASLFRIRARIAALGGKDGA